ncbi:hypothetical protein GCM10025771_31910 [Niveibacterium umoris]
MLLHVTGNLRERAQQLDMIASTESFPAPVIKESLQSNAQEPIALKMRSKL